jgi:hypothetical protein
MDDIRKDLPPAAPADGRTARVTGEEWIVQKKGAYLPGAYEEVCHLTIKSYCRFLLSI